MCSSSRGQNCITQRLVSSHQLDAQNLSYNKFYFTPLHVSSTCARNTQRHEIKLNVKQILCIKLVKHWDARSAKRQKINETSRWLISCCLAAKEPGNKVTFGASTHAQAHTHTHTRTHTEAPFLRTHTVKEDEGEHWWGGALWRVIIRQVCVERDWDRHNCDRLSAENIAG